MNTMESLNIGSSPHSEECAQVGDYDYQQRGRAECRALIGQLKRMYGEEPAGARLYIKGNSHDFGTYYEVECKFNTESEVATSYAFQCENMPEKWDEQSRAELALIEREVVQ